MSSPGQRKGACGHIMASYDKHSRCARCWDKGHGEDPCVKHVPCDFYPTALKGCQGIVFTHGVRMGGRAGVRAGGRAAGNSLSGLYLRNRKV